MWLLQTSNTKASDTGNGRVANTVSMSDYCDVIQRCVFYADLKDCPDLKL